MSKNLMKNMSMCEKLFLYLLLVPALVMFVGMFFSNVIVSAAYFMAIVVGFVIFILDRHDSGLRSNSKLVFIMSDVINFVAVVTIIYYEHLNSWQATDILLFVFAALTFILVLVDALYVKNDKIPIKGVVFIDLLTVGTMICILCYYFKVSSLWFAIDAIVFESVVLVLKLVLNRFARVKKESVVTLEDTSEEQKIEELIHSAGENEKEQE